MSLISVEELRGRSFTIGNKLQRTRRRRFLVKSDTKREDELLILAAVPSISVPYYDSVADITDLLTLCQSIDIEQDEKNAFYYRVTCNYSKNDAPDDEKPEDPEDPTSTAPRVDGFSWSKTKLFIKDKDDAKILNGAGQPFRDPLQREVKLSGFRVTMRKPAAFDRKECRTYRSKVNDATFQDYPARTLWLNDVVFSTQFDHGIKYYEFTYEILEDPDTFDEVLANLGMKRLDADDNLQPIFVNGEPIREPVFLKNDGRVEDPGVLSTLTFKIWKEADFSDSELGLSGVTLA